MAPQKPTRPARGATGVGPGRVTRQARWSGSPDRRPATDADQMLGQHQRRTLTRLLLLALLIVLGVYLLLPGVLFGPLIAALPTRRPPAVTTTIRFLLALHPFVTILCALTLVGVVTHLVVGIVSAVLQARARARVTWRTFTVLPPLKDGLSPLRGVDVFASLTRLTRPHGRWRGQEEALVFALVRDDDGRAALRVRVPDARTTDYATLLRTQLTGLVPGTTVRPLHDADGQPVDDLTDALDRTRTPGAVLGWIDVTMERGVEYPLMDLLQFDGDPMGALAAALHTTDGVQYCGYEIIVRAVEPRWRDGVRAQVARIQGQLAPGDMAAHEVLLRTAERVAYDVVVRCLVVASDVTAGRTQLIALRDALGQFDRETRGRRQRLDVPLRDRIANPQARSGQFVPVATLAPPDPDATTPRVRRVPQVLRDGGPGLLLGALGGGVLTWLPTWPAQPLVLPQLPMLAGAVVAPLPLLVLVLSGALLGAVLGTGAVRQQRQWPQQQRARLRAHAHRYAWVGGWTYGGLVPGTKRSVMSVGDLASLWHPPSAELHGLVAARTIPHLPTPAWAVLPEADAAAALAGTVPVPPRNPLQLRERRLALAWGYDYTGRRRLIGPTVFDLRKGLELLGPMGAGKSSMVERLAYELARVGAGFGVIDAKGDLADRLIAALPPAARARIVFVDTSAGSLPCINPLDRRLLRDGITMEQMIGHVEQLFLRMDPETWPKAMGMQQFARMGLRAILEGEPTPTLLHLDRFFSSFAYRTQILARVTNPHVRDFWLIEYPQMDPKLLISCDSFRRRLQHLITDPLMQQFCGQAESTLYLPELMDTRTILIVKLVPEVLSESVAALLATALLAALEAAAFARQRRQSDPDLRWDWPLIIDEVQKFIDAEHPGAAETFFTQTRSLGVGIIGAHQGLYQYSDAVRAAALQSLGGLAILGPIKQDARYLMEAYAETGITEAQLASVRARQEMLLRFPVHDRDTGLLDAAPCQRPYAVTPSAALRDQLLIAGAGAPYHAARAPAPQAQLDSLLTHLWQAPDPAQAAERFMAYLQPQEQPPAALHALLAQLAARSTAHRHAQAAALAAAPAQLPDAAQLVRELSRLRSGVDPVIAACGSRLLSSLYPAEIDPAMRDARGRGGHARPAADAAGTPQLPGAALSWHVPPRLTA